MRKRAPRRPKTGCPRCGTELIKGTASTTALERCPQCELTAIEAWVLALVEDHPNLDSWDVSSEPDGATAYTFAIKSRGWSVTLRDDFANPPNSER